MIEQHHTSRPKYRVTGGILLGSRGQRPMAFTDDDEAPSTREVTTSYAARSINIMGLPRRVRQGVWSVGPMIGQYITSIAPAWEGGIPEGGCSFYLYEEFSPSLREVSPGKYLETGGYVAYDGPLIVQRPWNYVDTESQSYIYDSSGTVTRRGISMLLISVVYEQDGMYYFCTYLSDPYTFPTSFDIEHPL